MSVACAVLAAGGSVRLGSPKQLLVLEGRTLIERSTEAACASRCEQVAIVLGAHAQTITRALRAACAPQSVRAVLLENPDWATKGLASSMHCAVRWAQAHGAQALLLCVCDQPQLTARHLDRLYEAHLREGRSIASRYNGTLGVPALIEAALFERLLTIHGDRGAAPLLRSGISVGEIDWPEGAFDLDTPSDVARFQDMLRATDRA